MSETPKPESRKRHSQKSRKLADFVIYSLALSSILASGCDFHTASTTPANTSSLPVVTSGITTNQRVDLSNAGAQLDQVASSFVAGDLPTNGFQQVGRICSANGRYVLFLSADGPDKVVGGPPSPVTGSPQLYLRDTQAGTTELISQNDAGAPANINNFQGATISEDGNLVVFIAERTNPENDNLAGSPSTGFDQIYIRDRGTHHTTHAAGSPGIPTGSLSSGDPQSCRCPSLSRDGRYLSFNTTYKNFTGVNDLRFHSVVVDLLSPTLPLEIEDRTTSGSVAALGSSSPMISPDGRFVVFGSASDDLSGPVNSFQRVYLRDRTLSTLKLVSQTADGVDATEPVVSNNADKIAYTVDDRTEHPSLAVIQQPTSNSPTILLVGTNQSGQTQAQHPALSDDGRFITYCSTAISLVSEPLTPGYHVFTTDLQTGETQWASRGIDGASENQVGPSGGEGLQVSMSGDGTRVIFVSRASNLVLNDSNDSNDVFSSPNPILSAPPASPGTLTFTAPPTTGQAGQALPSFSITVKSASGATVSGVPVMLSLGSGPTGASLGGTLTATSDTNGVATFTGVTPSTAGSYALNANATGYTATSTSAFTVLPAAGQNMLSVNSAPQSTVAGSTITGPNGTPVRFRVLNSQNAGVSGVTVTVALGNNPSSATLTGTLSATTDSTGVASFSNLKINNTGSNYTLVASSPNLTSVTTPVFSITAVAPVSATQVAFINQPDITQFSGQTITVTGGGPLRVQLQDGSGGAVASAGVAVRITVTPATTAQVEGDNGTQVLTATTDATGVASFGSLKIDGSGTNLKLVAASTGLTSATGTVFDLINSTLPSGTKQGYLFVGNQGHGSNAPTAPESIRVLKYDSSTGALSSASQILLPSGASPSHVALTGDKKYLLVVGNGTNSVYVYSFNPATAALTLQSTYTGTISPYSIFQSTAFQNGAQVNRFYLTSQGISGSPSLPGFLVQLDLDPATGSLSQVGSNFNLGNQASGISGFDINDGFDYLYVANTADGTVSAVQVERATNTVNLLNNGVAGASPTEVVVDGSTANGRQVFVTNRGLNSKLAQFRIDDSIGADYGYLLGLDPMTGQYSSAVQASPIAKTFVTGPNPVGVAFSINSHGGSWVYTANAGTVSTDPDNISGFVAGSIDPNNAPLTHPLLSANSADPGTPYTSGGDTPAGEKVVILPQAFGSTTLKPVLYVANRGSDSIAVERVSDTDGTLTAGTGFSLHAGDQPYSMDAGFFTIP